MSSNIRSFSKIGAVMAATSLLAGSALTQAQEIKSANDIPVEAFAQLPAVSGMELSPDGTHLAYITTRDGRRHVRVQSLDGSFSLLIPPVDDADIAWFRWGNKDKIVLSYAFTGIRNLVRTRETRLFAVDFKSKESVDLIKPGKAQVIGSNIGRSRIVAQIQDRIIDWLPDDPDHFLLSIDSNRDGKNEVRRVNINNGNYSELNDGNRGIQHWWTDQSHELRYGVGYDDEIFRRLYFSAVEGRWRSVERTKWGDMGLTPEAFESDPRFALASGQNEDGRAAIVRINLESGDVLETVFSHEQVDADGVAIDELTNKPVGVYFTIDQPEIFYLDEGEGRLQKMVDGALPNMVNRVVSRVNATKMFLISSRSDTEPGVYYLLDRGTSQMHYIAETMPGVLPEHMSPMQPIKYEARDGQEIPGYLTVPKGVEPKNLPVVVMPHGGPHARNTQMFDYFTQFLASRGYAVLQPNFRGSSGYGSEFENAGKQQWGGLMQDDVTDGTKWLVDQGIADPKRICIVGGSYGGYAAAMGAIKTPDLFACAASFNGVLDLPAMIANDKKYIGGSVWTKSVGFEGEKAKSVSPIDQAEAIRIPLLIIHAKDDYNVPYKQAQTTVKRLKKLKKDVTFVTLKDGDHNLDTEASRLTTLKAIEAFLDKHIGS